MERRKLVRKGMACDKQRRTVLHVEWRSFLEHNALIRALLCLAFGVFALFCGACFFDPAQSAIVLIMPPSVALLTLIIIGISILLLTYDQRDIWTSNSKVFLLFGSIAFNLFVSKAFFVWSVFHQRVPVPELVFWVPMAFAPLLITVLLGMRAGMHSVFVSSLLDSLLVNQNFPLLIISLIVGFTAVLFSRNVRRRGDLIRAGIAIGLASLFCAVAFGLLSHHSNEVLLEQAGLGIAIGIGTAMIVGSILPIIETVFGIATDISWVELADLNHPLLRQLTLEAPGTYHHSLVVANLAEAAANAIGANGTLCRVMAYFHDIGKVEKPEYFSENASLGSESPHDSLSPTMSALIIISHVKEGVDLAVKSRLKKPIIDAIREHHGTSQVYYFYRRALQMTEDAKAGSGLMNLREEDVPDVPEENFRYPGPIPQSKETGILMLADAIEGTSRSLEKPTPQRIEDLVNELVAERIASHQLDESGLSLKELRVASESFIFTLKTMHHSRISYPKHAPAPSGTLQFAKRVPSDDDDSRAAAAILP